MGENTTPPKQPVIKALPPVFNAKSLVLTEKNGGGDDAKPPSFGRLNVAAMTSESALAEALPGNDTKVVHGDYIAHLMNNRIIEVHEKDTLKVEEDQEHTIHGETKLTYMRGRDAVVGDEDKLAVNGVQEKFVLGESEERYIGKHEIHAPQEFEMKLLESGLTVAELKFMGGSATVRGREATYSIQDLECSIFKGEEHVLHEKAEGHEGHAAALTDTAAVTADVNPRVDAAPDIGVGTPFR